MSMMDGWIDIYIFSPVNENLEYEVGGITKSSLVAKSETFKNSAEGMFCMLVG
jgi:hypothetical protein